MTSAVQLPSEILREIFPKAPADIVRAFEEKQIVLYVAGINMTRQRLAYFFANIHHETAGFTIRNLTENINYTAARMAQVWPNRFKNAAAVQAKYGTRTGWQKMAFDDIYGNRMGNRLGTSDGSTFIGRGGPQITGRDGYAQISKRIGVDLVANPEMASEPELQPDICAAFWSWKNMNRFADNDDFRGCVVAWNGGTNGLADRQKQLARITKILANAKWGPISGVKQDPIIARPLPEPETAPTETPTSFWAKLAKIFRG